MLECGMIWQKAWEKVHPSWIIVMSATGIIVGDILVITTGWTISQEWLWLGAALLFTTILISQRWMLALALLAGILLMGGRTSNELRDKVILEGAIGQTMEITGTIARDPETDESSTSYQLDNLKIGKTKLVGKIYIAGSVTRELVRGDTVTVRGKLSTGFGTFAGAMYRPALQKIIHSEPLDPLLAMRNALAEQVHHFIPEPEAALGLGYLLGIKSGLPQDLSALLRIVGLTHIIVTSGTHLSILVGFARKIFGKLSRFAGLFFAILLVLMMMGMVGMTPSIVRAGIVSILSLIAWYVGRKFVAWRIILLVAAITLFYQPMYLIDLAWLLSFGSFIGVMIIGPRLTYFFYGDRKPHLLAETMLASLSATLICLPILLYFFGTMSLISLVANVLILPTIPLTMGLIFATGMIGLLSGIIEWVAWMSNLLGWISRLLLDYHLAIVRFLGEQTSFLIEIPKENPLVFILYVPMIGAIMLSAIKHNIKIGKGNTSHQNRTTETIDASDDVSRKII